MSECFGFKVLKWHCVLLTWLWSLAIISSRSPSPSNSYFFSMDTCQTRSGCISSRRAMLLYYMKYVQYAQHPRSPHLSGRETPSSSLGRRGAIYVNALSSSFLPSFVRSFFMRCCTHKAESYLNHIWRSSVSLRYFGHRSEIGMVGKKIPLMGTHYV